MTGQTNYTPRRAGGLAGEDRPMSRETLAAELEERILGGELPAGAKLPSERQLSDRYRVSRPIVREALRSLVERDLVDVQPGRGAYVRAARTSDAAGRLDALYRRTQATSRDLVEARTMLECTAAGLAAQRATADDLSAMEMAYTRLERCPSIVDRARYDLAFHLAIARAAHNPVIETMFGSIAALTVELMLRSLSDPTVTRISLPYHRAIFDAVRARDAASARAAMERHLGVATSLYGEDYDRSVESVAQRELARLLSPGATLDDILAATTATAQGESDGRANRV